jgi:hypothetical protein
MATVATRQNESSSYEKQERIHLTPTGLLMEGDYTQNRLVMSVKGMLCQLMNVQHAAAII